MAYLIVAADGKKRKLEITTDFIFVGTGPENQVRLDDPQVSTQHCQILRVDGGFRLLDLGSDSGTKVNGQAVTQVDLKEGDVIQVGSVRMAVKGAGEGRPVQEAKPTAPIPGSKTSKGRRRKKKSREPLEIKAEYAEASEGGQERLVRRNLRKGSKTPGWVQALAVFWVVVALVFICYFIFKQTDSPYHDTYMEGLALRADGQYDAAIAVMDKIPADDSDYGQLAADEKKKYAIERDAGSKADNQRKAKSWFENNIELFIFKYIDAPKEGPKKYLEKKIKSEYAQFRKSYIKTLLKRRIDPYLKDFPNAAQVDQVKAFKKKYLPEVEHNSTTTFTNTRVEAQTELVLLHYGEAFTLMNNWQKKYPDTKKKPEIEVFLKQVYDTFKFEWEREKKRAAAREKDNDFRGANSIYHSFLTRTKDYDQDHVKELRSYWQKKFDQNEGKLAKKKKAAMGG